MRLIVLGQKLTTRPRLYFVKMDIKSAFDTIKQDKMLEIIENLLDQVSEAAQHEEPKADI